MKVSKIFEVDSLPRTDKQGYTIGDKNYWYSLQKHFERFETPYTLDKFIDEFYNYYKLNVGISLVEDNEMYVKKFDNKKGGLTNGVIVSNYWLKIALPYLLERLEV